MEKLVCPRCGGKLDVEKRDTICRKCNRRVYFGVEPDVFALAQQYIDWYGLHPYRDDDDIEREENRNRQEMCEIIKWLRDHDKGRRKE